LLCAKPADIVKPTKRKTNTATRKIIKWRLENLTLSSRNAGDPVIESITIVAL
jgi:hypothetical protein